MYNYSRPTLLFWGGLWGKTTGLWRPGSSRWHYHWNCPGRSGRSYNSSRVRTDGRYWYCVRTRQTTGRICVDIIGRCDTNGRSDNGIFFEPNSCHFQYTGVHDTTRNWHCGDGLERSRWLFGEIGSLYRLAACWCHGSEYALASFDGERLLGLISRMQSLALAAAIDGIAEGANRARPEK